MNVNIRKHLGASILTVVLLLAAAIPGLAENSRNVTLRYGAVLSGTNLSAGQYNIRWQTHSPEATVQFVQHHKVLLTAEGRVEARNKSYDRNEVVYYTAPDGSLSLAEIRFAGSSNVLVFNQ